MFRAAVRMSSLSLKVVKTTTTSNINMSSPADYLRRLSMGGQLAPFAKSVCVYFLALRLGGGGGGGGAPAASPAAAAFKCAPVLSLFAVVAYRYARMPAGKGRYVGLVSLGLLISAVGDALLVWPEHLAAGMGAFAAAHCAYIAAFGWRRLRPAVAVLVYAGACWYLKQLSPPGAFRYLVPAYAALLATTAWRGAARGSSAAAGALLFLLSDAILGYSLFGGDVPNKQVLVMSTYYLGQLGIAHSALAAPAPGAPLPAPAL